MNSPPPNRIGLKIVGLLLAAGQSSRMTAGHHKLLAEFDGVALVRRSAEIMLSSRLASVTVVTGHRHSEIANTLRGLPLDIVYNEHSPQGIGTSLARGFRHKTLNACDGVLVMLADMPEITVNHIDGLLDVFVSHGGDIVVRGADGGKPGHPVILPPALFGEMQRLEGDDGAKAVLRRTSVPVHLIDFGRAALKDVDTLGDLLSAGGKPEPDKARGLS